MNFRRFVLVPILGLLGSTLALSSTSPAAADAGNAFDVYAVQGSDLRVNSGSCRNVPLSVFHDGYALEDAYASVEIWRGSSYIESAILLDNSPSRISGHFLYCPYLTEGLGTFRAGPTDVNYATYDYADTGEFRDGTTGRFTIKQDARLRSFSAKKKGKVRTFSVKGTFYSINRSSWMSFQKGDKLSLERRASNGRGSWKRVKTFRAKKGGRATVSVKAKRKYQYRVTASATKNTWGASTSAKRK